MVSLSVKKNEAQQSKLEPIKSFFLTYWGTLLVGFCFCITRLRYITYPLGLVHRQVVKEGYRSYEAITSSREFSFVIYEQPIFVILLEILYNITGKSPDNLVIWARIMGFIFSAISLIIIYKISEMAFGDIAAKFASFLYSLSPYGIFLNLGIQRETLMWLFGLSAIFFLLKYLETENAKYIIFNLAFSILAILTKLTGFYFLFTSIISLVLFYSGSPFKARITLRKRFFALFLISTSIILFSLLFAIFSVEGDSFSALRNTIVHRPEALFDTNFWGTAVVFAMIHIPITTVLLGGIGFFLALLPFKKESLVIILWFLFTGMEFVFYGYGAIIHEYYILYLLPPLVVLAGKPLLLLYEVSLSQMTEINVFPSKFASPGLILILLLCSSFVPLFNYTGETKIVDASKPFYEDVRSIGLFLNDYDIQGREIAIIYWKENYTWWKSHLTLMRTYIAKPNIDVIYTYNISEIIYWRKFKAIIGWRDDLNQVKGILALNFANYTFYSQNYPFKGI
ncbi:MAG: glycosyltransferase family 39 protein, partial [Candidatus Hodarchaeota archaeon]